MIHQIKIATRASMVGCFLCASALGACATENDNGTMEEEQATQERSTPESEGATTGKVVLAAPKFDVVPAAPKFDELAEPSSD